MTPRKAMKWKNGLGFTVKRKARKHHACTQCYRDIRPNEEYYQLNYYEGNKHYPICENCWKGPKLSATSGAKFKDTDEEASEFKPDIL
jgi:hypothetical protein